MYFDQNILRILYSITDDTDISDVEGTYLASCLSSALQALLVYKATNKNVSEDFLEDSIKFESIFENNNKDLDLELASEILDRLRGSQKFDEVYQSYVDIINEELYNSSIKRDPEVLEELQEYLNLLKDAYTIEYFNRFVKNAIDIETEANSTSE